MNLTKFIRYPLINNILKETKEQTHVNKLRYIWLSYVINTPSTEL